jgi:hypothetical protein
VKLGDVIPDCVPQFGVLDGKQDFDPPIQIARHEIRAAEEDLLVTTVAEVVDPRVLQKPADYRGHGDVLADARHSRPETADSTHLEIDLNAGLRGLVQRSDAGLVDKRVHLESDPARAVPLVTADLTLDSGDHGPPHAVRRDEDLAVLLFAGVAGKSIEEVGDVSRRLRIAGEIAEIAIDLGGHRIVVSGTEMHVTSHSFGLASYDHAHLGVGLEADEPVHDVHSRLLQGSRPDDIVFLVEAGLELDDSRDLFAVFARFL